MPPKAQRRRLVRPGISNIGAAGVEEEAANATDSAVEPSMTQDVSMASENALSGERQEPDELTPSQSVYPSVSETAASSPSRGGVQRLASTYPRGVSSTNARAGRGSSSDLRSGRQKFQPKSYVRRSKEEREAAEKAEAERQQARMATETLSVPTERGGSFTRGRALRSASMRETRGDRLSRSGATGHLGANLHPGYSTRARRIGAGTRTSPIAGDHAQDGTVSGIVTEASVQNSSVKAEKDKDGDVAMDGARPGAAGVESKMQGAAGGRSKSGRKRGTHGAGPPPTIKNETQIPEYPWSEDEELEVSKGRRVNIEEINLITDEETEEEDLEEGPHKGKTRQSTPHQVRKSFKPIRLDRHQHVERAVGINTDASSLTSAELRRRAQEGRDAQGSLFLDSNEDLLSPKKAKGRGKTKDVEFVRNERKWQGVYQEDELNDTSAQVKKESQEDDLMAIDEAPAISGAPEPNSIDAGTTQTTEDVTMAEAEIQPSAASPSRQPADETQPQPPKFQRRQPKAKQHRPPKPVHQTEEDRQEWRRLQRDGEITSKTLSQLGGQLGSALIPQDSGSDLDMEALDEEAESQRSRDLFLFQFSPVLPLLIDADSQAQIKAEPSNNDPSSTSTQPEHATSSPRKPAGPKPTRRRKVDPKAKSSTSKPAISTQPTVETLTPPAEAPEAITEPLPTYTSFSPRLPPGHFGLLRLHDSHRVTADWGNLRFEISRGADENMAQEIVVCDWSKVVVKKEEWEMDTDPWPEMTEFIGGGNGLGAETVCGDEVTVKEEQRREWREEVNCGSTVWAMGDVGGGTNGTGASFVAVPSWGEMFGF
ncbi:MAG: hypothetical protein Q9191_005183 [Dirinaria sp. TL-2023a]